MSRLGTFGVAMLTGLVECSSPGSSRLLRWTGITFRGARASRATSLSCSRCSVLRPAWSSAGSWRGCTARGRGFFRALGASLGVVVAIGAVSGGLARALADVPPALDGETMLLAVEVRWPETKTDAPAVTGPDEAFVSLHSIPHFSHTVRASARGPLWIEDARRVDGRWIVPGAVEVFTSRGTRMLTVHTGEKGRSGIPGSFAGVPSGKGSRMERLASAISRRSEGPGEPAQLSIPRREGEPTDSNGDDRPVRRRDDREWLL